MMHRTSSAILFLLLSCVTAYGQTSYKVLTPGKSTKAHVERLLGQPAKKVRETPVEYKPSEDLLRLFVQYRDGEVKHRDK